jgi:D-alanyl-D-alanine carboxypeptidase/D-alanyl-D-alanine-endopeptidase (penicillin-binding protein 4)
MISSTRRTIRSFRPVARALAAVFFLATCSPVALAQDLQNQIRRKITGTELAKASMTAVALDPASGRVLFSINPQQALIPASNMKLLTSGAALMVLGEDFTFDTRLDRSGDRIILVGSGDPAFGDPVILNRSEPPLTIDDLLSHLVGAVKERGPDSISELVVDDRIFDRQYVHPSWPIEQLNLWYCAEIGGVNVYTNVLALYPKPAPEGVGAPLYSVEPAVPWIEFENNARTVTSGRQTFWIARPQQKNEFSLRGDVRSPGVEAARVAIHNPPLFTGQLLAQRLAAAGQSVGTGGTPGLGSVRLAEPDERFEDATTMAVVRTPLADVLERCNTQSHNLYAEALIKRVGQAVTSEPGSWSSGAAVIRSLISERLGPDHANRTRIADGSGMSRENRVSAETLVAWLVEISQDDRVYRPMLASLATPGEGTLRTRFQGQSVANQIYAKSGYLNGVRGLSGYVVAPNGEQVVFAMLMNDIPSSVSTQSRVFMEEAVVLIDQWLADRVADQAALGG